MKHIAILSAASLLLLLTGCGRSDKAPDSRTGGGSSKGGGTSCLAKYDTRIGEILPLNVLSEVVDLQGASPEMKVTDTRSMKGVSWSWPSDRQRIMEMMGTQIEIPVDNQLSLSHFRRLDNAEFGPKDGKTYVEANYRSISKEEMADIQTRMREQIQERVRRGELTEEQARLAGGMGGDLMGEERIVESIEGVGDAARWIEKDRTLAVGHRNVAFTVFADISADAGENRATAIALAQRLLKDCP